MKITLTGLLTAITLTFASTFPAQAQLAAGLRQQKVIVRHFKLPRIDQHLRISIGTDAQCQALVDALKTLLPIS